MVWASKRGGSDPQRQQNPLALMGLATEDKAGSKQTGGEKVQGISSLLSLVCALLLCLCHVTELSFGLETLFLPLAQEIYRW